jgi:hypothetical protein
MSEADDLRAQASQLNELADNVESLLDGAKSYITDTMTTWEGPNRNDVEDLLDGYKADCREAATNLRNRATGLGDDADALEEEGENGDGE